MELHTFKSNWVIQQWKMYILSKMQLSTPWKPCMIKAIIRERCKLIQYDEVKHINIRNLFYYAVYYSYFPGLVWYLCYYRSPRQSQGWLLITRISYKCAWNIYNWLITQKTLSINASFVSSKQWLRLCSTINLFLWFLNQVCTWFPEITFMQMQTYVCLLSNALAWGT